MVLPLYILLIIFGGALTVFGIFFVINVYHIQSTGTFTRGAAVVTGLVVVLSIAVIVVTVFMLKDVEWTRRVTVFGSVHNTFQGSGPLIQ